MLSLQFSVDSQNFKVDARKLSDSMQSCNIPASQTKELTVPTFDGKLVMVLEYSPSSEFWLAIDGVAESPAGSEFAATDSVLNPSWLQVESASTVSIKNNASSTKSVSISFYAVP